MRKLFPFIERIVADAGHQGPATAAAVRALGPWQIEIVKRSGLHRVVVLPKRWIVERTFAWMGRNGRLSKDYENTTRFATADLRLAMIGLMLRRLVRLAPFCNDQLFEQTLSLPMGLQNAVVTRISHARVRTTHVTGMVTDIGIELGNLLDLAVTGRAWRRLDSRDGEAEYSAGKLLPHGVTVLSFLGGGVLAYRRLGPLFLFGAALLLLLIALPGVIRRGESPVPRHKAD